MPDTQVICIVPFRNESWILKHFVESALTWADLVILGDHNSTDGGADLVRGYDRVKVIPIPATGWAEDIRRIMLIAEARKLTGRRLIVSLDADEMLSANCTRTPEWQRMLGAEPGTCFSFDWLEILPGLERAAVFKMTGAFLDDGSEYHGPSNHSPRVPDTGKPIEHLSAIKLLHYILIDPERMFSRHRFYKCREFVEEGRRAWTLCVTYQDTKIKTYDAPVIDMQPEWLAGYTWLDEYKGDTGPRQTAYWWDGEVLKLFDTYGAAHFSKINVWDIDWNAKARLLGKPERYADPRSPAEVRIHQSIAAHREQLKLRTDPRYRLLEKAARTLLKPLGW